MATLAERVSDHGRWIGEHERRLDLVEPKVDTLRAELAKLFGLAMFATVVLTVIANALVVHYLTPTQQTPPPSAALRTR